MYAMVWAIVTYIQRDEYLIQRHRAVFNYGKRRRSMNCSNFFTSVYINRNKLLQCMYITYTHICGLSMSYVLTVLIEMTTRIHSKCIGSCIISHTVRNLFIQIAHIPTPDIWICTCYFIIHCRITNIKKKQNVSHCEWHCSFSIIFSIW